ncbi:MAG: universal stress protein [Pseudomonadaceae bacterium]|nr:universal stress protein [Pseudomonadaceae bacterium]
MNSAHHCLAATDLSGGGNLAIARAMQLSAQLDMPLDLLHVLPQDLLQRLQNWLSGARPEVLERLLQQSHEELAALAEHFASADSRAPGILVREGDPASVIAAEADARASELLVVGAHGAGHLHETMVGSTPLRLLGLLECALLIVRQACAAPYKRVLVAVDFSPRSLPLLQLAARIAPQGERILLHALDLPYAGRLQMAGISDSELQHYRKLSEEQALEQCHRLTEGSNAGLAHRCEVRFGEASLCIQEYAREQACDLILLAQHPRSRVGELLLGSTTRHVLHQSSQDLLILRQ